MSKIIQVINMMICHPEKITNVIKSKNDEYYFLYDNKYKWSILENQAGFSLFIYTNDKYSLEQLAALDDFENYTALVHFSSIDYSSKEGIESFSELRKIVGQKLFNVDKIFDDILSE